MKLIFERSNFSMSMVRGFFRVVTASEEQALSLEFYDFFRVSRTRMRDLEADWWFDEGKFRESCWVIIGKIGTEVSDFLCKFSLLGCCLPCHCSGAWRASVGMEACQACF